MVTTVSFSKMQVLTSIFISWYLNEGHVLLALLRNLEWMSTLFSHRKPSLTVPLPKLSSPFLILCQAVLASLIKHTSLCPSLKEPSQQCVGASSKCSLQDIKRWVTGEWCQHIPPYPALYSPFSGPIPSRPSLICIPQFQLVHIGQTLQYFGWVYYFLLGCAIIWS